MVGAGTVGAGGASGAMVRAVRSVGADAPATVSRPRRAAVSGMGGGTAAGRVATVATEVRGAIVWKVVPPSRFTSLCPGNARVASRSMPVEMAVTMDATGISPSGVMAARAAGASSTNRRLAVIAGNVARTKRRPPSGMVVSPPGCLATGRYSTDPPGVVTSANVGT